MKKIIVILALFLSGCKVEQFDPVQNDFSVIGLWWSRGAQYTYDIKRADGKGGDETFLEYWDGGKRYLRRTFFGYPTRWEIIRITATEMWLTTGSNGAIVEFDKIPIKKP